MWLIEALSENPRISIGNIQIELTQDDLQQTIPVGDGQDRGTFLFPQKLYIREAFFLTSHPVPAAQLFELLATSGLQHILRSNGWSNNLASDDEDDESDEDFDAPFIRRMRPRRTGGADQFPKVPSDEGTELMGGGQFGTNQYYVDRLKKRKRVFAQNLMWRELGTESPGVRRRADQSISQVNHDWNLANGSSRSDTGID